MKGFKRMKNFIVSAVFASLFALVASADVSYFYWGVNAGSEYAFNYATIKAVQDETTSDFLKLYQYNSSSGATKLYANKDLSAGTTTGNIFADVSGYTTGSQYLVELWSTDTTSSEAAATVIAWQKVDYSDVTANIFTQMGQSGNQPYTFSNFVPEPTSGLLLLLGSAALALRRKQKVA